MSFEPRKFQLNLRQLCFFVALIEKFYNFSNLVCKFNFFKVAFTKRDYIIDAKKQTSTGMFLSGANAIRGCKGVVALNLFEIL